MEEQVKYANEPIYKFVPMAIDVRNYVSDPDWSEETEAMIWEQYRNYVDEEIVYKALLRGNEPTHPEAPLVPVFDDWTRAAREACIMCQHEVFESPHTAYPAVLRLADGKANSVSFLFTPAMIGVFQWTIHRLDK